MTSRTISICGLGLIPMLFPLAALGDVALSTDVAGGTIERHFVAGEVVTATLSICSHDDSPVLGVELDLACTDARIRIRNVEINPVFAMPLGIADFGTGRVQLFTGLTSSDVDMLNRSFGNDLSARIRFPGSSSVSIEGFINFSESASLLASIIPVVPIDFVFDRTVMDLEI